MTDVTIDARLWADVPAVPALYAMYGGDPPRTWVAYVGIAGSLNGRLIQHFVRRDSSVVTSTSAVGVNIDLVAYVDWWEGEVLADETSRHAAELVAFDVLDPALRSRGNVRREAAKLAADEGFVAQVRTMLSHLPAGRYTPPRLAFVADELISLRDEVAALRDEVRALRATRDEH